MVSFPLQSDFNGSTRRKPARRPQLAMDWISQSELPEKLVNLAQNKTAIDAYEANPFNPHAIARERFSAYPKAIVMKYIDNLLDWADPTLHPRHLRVYQ